MMENRKEMKKFAKDKIKTGISNKKIRGMLTVASGQKKVKEFKSDFNC